MYMNDTIAAIATGSSNSGIGIIRISGDKAIAIADLIFKPHNYKRRVSMLKGYEAAYGHIIDIDDSIIDEAIVLVMKAPHTYTAEDVVEIQCHGGMVVLNRILNLIILKGARIAEPGEYTKRAFLNGRIDLSQAESVIDLINSKNEFAAKSSISQLRGDLSDRIKSIRENILYNMAYIESALDDPEHYSLDGYADKLSKVVSEDIRAISMLINTYDNGKILKEGIKTVIVGKPNAGKSSVLNILLGEERAIVTDIAGTTRDTLEESIKINGINLNIIDTAGIRDTDDIVEKIGVDKAIKSIDDADLVLYIVDSSKPLDGNDLAIIEKIKDRKAIVIYNKMDLDIVVDKMCISSLLNKPCVDISAKNNVGFEKLYSLLNEMFFNGELTFNDEIYITNLRHKNALNDAYVSLHKVMDSIDAGVPEDFYTIDLTSAYESLGYIIGEALEDDLVNKIFKEFCMGK